MSSSTESVKNPQEDKFAVWKEKANRYAQHVLALPNDSFEKTIAVALGLCLVGAVLVSGSAVALKSLQESNKSKDEKKDDKKNVHTPTKDPRWKSVPPRDGELTTIKKDNQT